LIDKPLLLLVNLSSLKLNAIFRFERNDKTLLDSTQLRRYYVELLEFDVASFVGAWVRGTLNWPSPVARDAGCHDDGQKGQKHPDCDAHTD